MWRIIIAIFVSISICACGGSGGGPATPDETPGNPPPIIGGCTYATAADVPNGVQIITDVDEITSATGSYTMMQDITLTGDRAVITNFSGTFDGNCYKIIGLKITGTDNSGMFGTVSGEVKNIILESANISGENYVGSVAGHLNGGTITNIYVQGVVTGSNNVGGIVGRVSGNSTIDKSHVMAGSEIASIVSDSTVGGIAGSAVDTAVIINSSNAAKISGTIAGGIVGSAEGITVSDSYSIAEVSASGDDAQAGGITGRSIGGTIQKSFASGTVSASGSSAAAGGIVGYIDGSATITNSYSRTDVGSTGSGSMAGGMVGLLDTTAGSISNAYCVGAVSAETAGGFVGQQNGEDFALQRSIAINSNTTFGTLNDGIYIGVGAGNVDITDLIMAGDPNNDSTYKTLNFYRNILGWPFEGNTWKINEGADYPRLYFQ
jgi:hypothetical protein